jgi:hypothetical protein
MLAIDVDLTRSERQKQRNKRQGHATVVITPTRSNRSIQSSLIGLQQARIKGRHIFSRGSIVDAELFDHLLCD